MIQRASITILISELLFLIVGYGCVLLLFPKIQTMPAETRQQYFPGAFERQNVSVTPLGDVFTPHPWKSSAVQFLLYFIISTAVIFVVLRWFRNPRGFINILYYIALFGGVSLFLGVLFPGTDLWQVISMVVALGIVIVRGMVPLIFFQNIVFIITVAGMALYFALRLQSLEIVSVLLIVAIYDFVAVYFTKHMVYMAERIAHLGVGLFLIIPRAWRENFSIVRGATMDKKRFVLLGGGDIAFPLILSANMLRESFGQSLIVFGGALVGMLGSHLIFSYSKRAIPALPSIVICTVVAYFIARYLV